MKRTAKLKQTKLKQTEGFNACTRTKESMVSVNFLAEETLSKDMSPKKGPVHVFILRSLLCFFQSLPFNLT